MSRALPLTPGSAAARMKARRAARLASDVAEEERARARKARRGIFARLAQGWAVSKVARQYKMRVRDVRGMMGSPRTFREAKVAQKVERWEMAGKARVRA